jgi:adenylylsulfate kinase-like enzyme
MLKVKIEGPAGAGKTSLAALLDKLLFDAGYSVTVQDDAICGRGHTPTNLNEYIPATNDGRKVLVEVVSK